MDTENTMFTVLLIAGLFIGAMSLVAYLFPTCEMRGGRLGEPSIMTHHGRIYTCYEREK